MHFHDKVRRKCWFDGSLNCPLVFVCSIFVNKGDSFMHLLPQGPIYHRHQSSEVSLATPLTSKGNIFPFVAECGRCTSR